MIFRDLGPLFQTPPLARNTDPVTSHEAADRMVKSGAAASQRDACVKALAKCDGATSAELAAFMGTTTHVTGRRLSDARNHGEVHNGPPRDCRVNPGRAMTWWLGVKP